MYYLYETASGLSLFKVDRQTQRLVSYQPYKSIEEAFEQQKSIPEGELTAALKEFLQKNFLVNFKSEKLGVSDQHLAQTLKDKYSIKSLCTEETLNIHRQIQANLYELIPKLNKDRDRQYAASLAHNFSRYQIQFNSESVDSMILQSVKMLDESEKEINNYVMRLMEWAVWSFPEAQKVVTNIKLYCRTMEVLGADKTLLTRGDFNTVQQTLLGFLQEDQVEELINLAQISVGTEIAKEDADKIRQLAKVILQLLQQKGQIETYITARMEKIAPNFCQIVGPLIGAKLLGKAGSLLKLAKAPASTIQIIGAEATLFKALKAKQKTPKYGFIYNCKLISDTAQSQRGKMARKIAQNAAICVRYDALHEGEFNTNLGERYLKRCDVTTAAKSSKMAKLEKLQQFRLKTTAVEMQEGHKDVVNKGVVEIKDTTNREKECEEKTDHSGEKKHRHKHKHRKSEAEQAADQGREAKEEKHKHRHKHKKTEE